MFGAGTLEARVSEGAAQSGGRITVEPPVADLRARLGSFDAILMPSRFEGLPLLALEASCVGIPIIATNAPGLDEVFPDWYPGRCEPGDAPAFASLIRAFLADPAAWREQAVRARPWARDRFSLETMTASYERLYAGVASS
jgi:glycosyltransferase involved in cell wall biosynthesis